MSQGTIAYFVDGPWEGQSRHLHSSGEWPYWRPVQIGDPRAVYEPVRYPWALVPSNVRFFASVPGAAPSLLSYRLALPFVEVLMGAEWVRRHYEERIRKAITDHAGTVGLHLHEPTWDVAVVAIGGEQEAVSVSVVAASWPLPAELVSVRQQETADA